MQKYYFIFQKKFKAQMNYRSSTLLLLLSAAMGFVVQISLWTALIQSGVKEGITIQDMVTFITVNTVIKTFTHADIAEDIETEIQDGSAAMHFIRPLSFKLYWFSTISGQNAYRLFTSAMPVVILGAVFVGFSAPSEWWNVLFAVISAIIGMLIMFEITYIGGLVAFWVQKTWYISFYISAGTTLFGGTVVPFWFYPELLNRLSYFLPFRYVSFEAISLYLGQKNLTDGLISLAFSFGWLLVLAVISSLVWKRVQNKISVNGG